MTRTTTRSRTVIAAVAITLAFVAAGCGSSGGSDAGGTTAASGDASTTAGSSDAPVKLDGTVNDEGSTDISSDGDQADLEMELDDNYFKPTFIKAAPGATVTVELENEGDNPHTFTLDDGAIDQKLDPGAKAKVEVTIPADGFLRFSCDFHGSMGMQGAFYTDAGSGSGADSSGTTATTAAGGRSGY